MTKLFYGESWNEPELNLFMMDLMNM